MLQNNKNTKNLRYLASCREDLVHHFAPHGYEILSDSFTAYLDRVRPSIERYSALSLEVSGCEFSSADQAAICRALQYHYQLLQSQTDAAVRKLFGKLCWFVLSLIASMILLFLVKSDTSEVLTQFYYVPFWFFGYRILIYLVLDLPAIWKDRQWYHMLTRMELRFAAADKNSVFEIAQMPPMRPDLVDHYFMEGNTVMLECVTADPAEMLCPTCPIEKPLISDELASYIEQAIPFLKPEHQVRLCVSGCTLDSQQMQHVHEGIHNHFTHRIADVNRELRENRNHILLFSIGLVIASVLLGLVGSHSDVAHHEFIMIHLWFFADFLVEYILLTPRELLARRREYAKMQEMDVYQR